MTSIICIYTKKKKKEFIALRGREKSSSRDASDKKSERQFVVCPFGQG